MENTIPDTRKRDEVVAEKLRGIFEHRGFRPVRVGKFEEYDLYIDNRNFLQSENVITFMDMDGKLLALKPDVTLSVVKNMPKGNMPAFEKLYYMDEVCRLSRENREYKVLNQIGVELVGPADAFANIEIIDLALESLAAISGDYVLDISHQGFVCGLLEQAGLSHSKRSRLLKALHAKSPHDIQTVLEQAGTSSEVRDRILDLNALHGNIAEALPRAKALVQGEMMEEAYRELEQLCETLSVCGLAGRVNLDFSVVNDMDYYNGLIFLGYVEGVPNVVLTGGRYDNLMAKMGKQSGAIGFAVYLSDLNTYFKSGREYDFDMLITYGADCDYPALLKTVKELCAQGRAVRLEREGCDMEAAGIRCLKRYRFVAGALVEEEAGSC